MFEPCTTGISEARKKRAVLFYACAQGREAVRRAQRHARVKRASPGSCRELSNLSCALGGRWPPEGPWTLTKALPELGREVRRAREAAFECDLGDAAVGERRRGQQPTRGL